MVLDIRQRTNQENSTFVTDSEVTEYLNQELAELWGHLVQGEGHPHYRSSSTYSVTAQTTLQALPADFWRVQEVTATIGGITGTLVPFMAAEHGYLTNVAAWGPLASVRYRIQAGNIEWLPASQSFSSTLYYSPNCPRLVSGSDTFDGFSGYEMAAIYGVCAIIAAKEESDPGFHLAQKDRMYKLVDSLAGQRDAANPERVQDVVGWPNPVRRF
jgi:hypothetical protein